MIFITGDTHGQFERIAAFCDKAQTTKDDILIILGDAGINYHGGSRDRSQKRLLTRLPITLLSIHGNHEQRPVSIPSYRITTWQGGQVYVEDGFPNLLFAKDGEVYDLDGIRTLVIGGAYSVDKGIRLLSGYGWWPDEQPSDEIKRELEVRLDKEGWKVDAVLSHTTPLKYMPIEVFLPGVDQRNVDQSTEAWLDGIEDRLTYKRWYCGHYHTEKVIDRIILLFESIREFHVP
jgi:3-oxoacid CoA-transferase subunit A